MVEGSVELKLIREPPAGDGVEPLLESSVEVAGDGALTGVGLCKICDPPSTDGTGVVISVEGSSFSSSTCTESSFDVKSSSSERSVFKLVEDGQGHV